MSHDELRERVFEAMKNSTENGADWDIYLQKWEPIDIAVDICTYDSELDGEDPDEVEPFVREWMNQFNEDEESHL